MAIPTEFDLNGALRDWRAGLAASPAFKPDDLDQLEAHLRDSIATLQATGLSANEAFMVAQLRLGTPAALVGEFAKQNSANIWLQRLIWLLAGYVGINVLTSLVSSLGTLAAVALHQFSSANRHLATCKMIVQVVVLFSSLAFLIRRRQRLLDQFAVRVQAGPRLWGFLPFALMTLVLAMNMFGHILTMRFLPQNLVGEVTRWNTYFFGIEYLGWPLLLAWLVTHRSRKSVAPSS